VDFPVLAVLDPGDRAQLLADLRRREFGRNEVLVHEGDPADSMHLIAKGRVLVTLMNPNAERVDVAILGPGKCFGELSMLKRPERRTSTITAIEPTETLVLRRDHLDRLRRRYPSIDRLIAELLAEQIHRLGNELLDVLFVPAHASFAASSTSAQNSTTVRGRSKSPSAKRRCRAWPEPPGQRSIKSCKS
jgi:CRP-like cAMP-binding protein